MIKMLVLDLDGTVVNNDLKISERVLSSLKHLLTQTDIRVVIATGRMFPSALPFALDIGTREPIITYQGAMVNNPDGSSRAHTPIALELAREVTAELLSEDYHVNLYMHDRVWMRTENHLSERYSQMSGVRPVFQDDLLACLKPLPPKFWSWMTTGWTPCFRI